MIYHSPIIAFSSKVLLRMRSFVKLTKFIYLGMADKTESRSTLIVKNNLCSGANLSIPHYPVYFD